jgi:hypothetical protein
MSSTDSSTTSRRDMSRAGDSDLLRLLSDELGELHHDLANGARTQRAPRVDGPRDYRDVAIALALRGRRLINELRRQTKALSHDKIARSLEARDTLMSDCQQLVDEVLRNFAQLLSAKEAVDSSIVALSDCQIGGARMMSIALEQLQACALDSEAQLDELSAVLEKVDSLAQIILRAKCDETDLLRLAEQLIALVGKTKEDASASSLWDEVKECDVKPVATTSLMATASLLDLGPRPFSQTLASSAAQAALGRQPRGDDLSGTAPLIQSALSLIDPCFLSAASANLGATNRSIYNLARPWRVTLDTNDPRSSPVRDTVGELRVRLALRTEGSDGLHPLIALACCQTEHDAQIIDALSLLPFLPPRTLEQYSLLNTIEPASVGERCRGVRRARIDGRTVMLKPFAIADKDTGLALRQEMNARALLGDGACVPIVAAFVHGKDVWLEMGSAGRRSLADALVGDGLCRSWPRDLAAWRVLDAFRTFASTILAAHTAGLRLGAALRPDHLIIDSERHTMLLTSLWRTRAPDDKLSPSEQRAEDMLSFGRCLYAALTKEQPPDHPQLLEARLLEVRDVAVREMLGALLSPASALRPTAAQAVADRAFATMIDRMRTTTALVGLSHRKEVWIAHVTCLLQLSVERSPLRIITSRSNVVRDVIVRFGAMRSTEDLLRPMMASFDLHERIADDQGTPPCAPRAPATPRTCDPRVVAQTPTASSSRALHSRPPRRWRAARALHRLL